MHPDSPDPLTLPSSPLSAKPFVRRDPRAPSTKSRSPAKSFLIDPSLATHDKSPYRIRVTVSAEPTAMARPRAGSASPNKTRTKTVSVPLRGGDSSSPRKDATEFDGDATGLEAEGAGAGAGAGAGRRVKRKRKGTPVAPRRRARKTSPVREEGQEQDDDDDPPAPVLPESPVQQQQQQGRSSVLLPSSEIRRRRIPPMRTQRYARLSAARDELDLALQDAVGENAAPAFAQLSSDAVGMSSPSVSGAGRAGGKGDLTVANEDFTMISGEEMASIMAGTSLLAAQAQGEAEKTGVPVFPSSPPSEQENGEVRYPDLTEVSRLKEGEKEVGYDVMSWQPTRPAPAPTTSRSQRLGRDFELSRPREPVVIEDEDSSSSSDADEDEQDAKIGAPNPADRDEEAEQDDDIWAEEASRSLEDDAAPAKANSDNKQSKNSIPPIFSDQVVPPRRSKIPNTWRRVSGNDFLYSDSPARPTEHVEQEFEEREAEQYGEDWGMETDAESRRSSGVLTPPSTDDEAGKNIRATDMSAYVRDEVEDAGEGNDDEDVREAIDEAYEDDDQEISGLTEPNAADTQLEAHHRLHSSPDGREQATAAKEQVEEDEDEPTGYYWRQHKQKATQPSLSRPRPLLREEKKAKYDLSAILRMDESEVVPEAHTDTSASRNAAPMGPDGAADQDSSLSQSDLTASQTNTMAPPPRPQYRSARAEQRRRLRAQREGLQNSIDSSQSLSLDDSTVSKASDRPQPQHRVLTRSLEQSQSVQHSQSIDDSLASKASDQRQILAELKNATPVVKRKPASERLQVLRQQDVEISQQSYEENLNIESPQKIKVKFNDSSLLEHELHVAPRQSASLGARDANARLGGYATARESEMESRKPALVRTKPKTRLFDTGPSAASHPSQAQENATTGLLTRLTSTLWSNINAILPQGPTYTYSPPATASRTSANPPRSKLYGHLPASHPSNLPPRTHTITPTTPLPKSLQTLPVTLRAQLRSRYGVLPSQHPWTMAHMRTLHRLLNSLESGRADSIVPTHSPLPAELRSLVGRTQRTATGGSYAFGFEHACVVLAFMQLLVSPSLIEDMDAGRVDSLGDLQSHRLRGYMGGRHGAEVCFQTLEVGQGMLDIAWAVQALGCCVKANEEAGRRGGEEGGEIMIDGEEADDGFERAEVGSVMGDGRGGDRVRRWIGERA